MKAAGKTLKFLYTIPNFHNPAGVTLAAERRAEILEICRAEELLILEDNPYGLLGFDGEPLRALRADEAEGVIYLGSFSKTFAPGFRVGWALAPHMVREKLVLAQESATLCPPQFSQMAVSAYLSNHDWQGQIKQFREMYRERRDAMVEALHDMMPAACRWNVPDGGFYVWLSLPPGIDAKAMLPRAVTARVAYVPGTAFFADGFGSGAMRLSFCYPTPERIREGVRRLAGVIEAEMELRATFGANAPARELGYQSYDGPSSDLSVRQTSGCVTSPTRRSSSRPRPGSGSSARGSTSSATSTCRGPAACCSPATTSATSTSSTEASPPTPRAARSGSWPSASSSTTG